MGGASYGVVFHIMGGENLITENLIAGLLCRG